MLYYLESLRPLNNNTAGYTTRGHLQSHGQCYHILNRPTEYLTNRNLIADTTYVHLANGRLVERGQVS